MSNIGLYLIGGYAIGGLLACWLNVYYFRSGYKNRCYPIPTVGELGVSFVLALLFWPVAAAIMVSDLMGPMMRARGPLKWLLGLKDDEEEKP